MQSNPSTEAEEWERRGIEADSRSQHAEAEACFAKALTYDDSRQFSWVGLAFSQINQRRVDDAVASLQRAHIARPTCGIISHLLKAMTGETTSRAPNDYITFLFNGYAANFDQHLTSLQYQGPQMLAELIKRAGWAADGTRHIIDIGCGTGLSGMPLRAYAGRLEGADLSASMLEQALKRGIYNHLWHGEAHAVLRRLPAGSYDAVVAADTLVYIGDVAEFFRLAHAALRPGGDLLFTVEACDEGFALVKSGRYQHSDAYLKACADGLFSCADRVDGAIRTEAQQAIPGHAYRFSKPAA
ncbi:MAG: methyltransferase domain-containing protein [Ferrovibrio sp.]|uniref:class I SAM-dependent DNA methyltransferase n=1 Tax=Ferrovibrio sp. TaxID=1917215 RepID=UPI003918C97C